MVTGIFQLKNAAEKVVTENEQNVAQSVTA